MYGMINDAIKCMVTDKLGVHVWEEIRQKTSSPDSFEKMATYDDAITYNLVGAVCEVGKLEAQPVLEGFGRFWIDYAAKTKYGSMIRMFGENFKDCVSNLDHMHSKMGAMMPGFRAPQFACRDLNSHEYIVIYRSSRVGLSPMVKGLLEGLADYYGEKVEISSRPNDNLQLPPGIVEESHFLVKKLG